MITSHQQHVRLFRNGRNQAVRIPKDFEMDCDEAIIRKEGNKLVLEPVKKDGLLNILMSLEPIKETFPDVDESLLPLDDINI
ncbi:MAG: AbrB/MazE/SpoVT family DNA-binding domain-containing protein [Deltaproteobacteria bacterium]|jgi:antitoxin VapB|nr:AbrB/MazE/SpoVT family DNA-binding domain-containing protein [Deltaproteobacteria bacterium]MBT4528060.1 AbrB/MazE/SpoVT family DNA-binding domain-containing protein [Deltaproteobacteria bacterium]